MIPLPAAVDAVGNNALQEITFRSRPERREPLGSASKTV
jgi:hypothetical protein